MSRPQTPISETYTDLPDGASTSPTDIRRPPAGARTSHYFTDSAINIQPQTPTHSPKRKRTSGAFTQDSPSSTRSINNLSNRLTKLAAAAWAAEEDDRLDIHERQALQARLDVFEAQLEGRTRGTEQTTSDIEYDTSASSSEPSPSPSSPFNAPSPIPDLSPLLTHLSTTTSALQTRLTESRHLHALTLTNLSAIATRCAEQESAILALTQSIQSLRNENTHLHTSNSALHAQTSDLEAQIKQRDVGMEAMTGAVAGLEGWVRSASGPNTPLRQMQGQKSNSNTKSNRRTVTRGKGRFRGRYYIDDDGDQTPHAGATDMQDVNVTTELQEGIMGWVRGFRDIEDGLGSVRARDSPLMGKSEYKDRGGGRESLFGDDEDEFGDFQTGTEGTVVTNSTP